METLRARAEGFYVATMPVPEEAARLMADYLRDEMVHAQRQKAVFDVHHRWEASNRAPRLPFSRRELMQARGHHLDPWRASLLYRDGLLYPLYCGTHGLASNHVSHWQRLKREWVREHV